MFHKIGRPLSMIIEELLRRGEQGKTIELNYAIASHHSSSWNCLFNILNTSRELSSYIFSSRTDCTKIGYIRLGFIVRFSILHPILAMPISVCQKSIQRRMGGFSLWNTEKLASREQVLFFASTQMD